ncbi:NAD-dependent epimerase/dehydratase family protein [Levilactobacillus brevis]|uniref:NAD-dependent epimerase/dehydratase family protein n=1 Tax=Levilactobacillus brevis TaxID=1580 RepID=UPI0021A603E1|nr:NAD-dependent epimerase/dehydratase family protein [Levilactobacillus brevis]MCT3584708.1 NAD-dependent epimerase/dehydratase family protein [Levilactobacillus brevis]
MSNEKVLVTGGNGFLALHIIQHLLIQNYPVRATLRRLDKAKTVRQALTNVQTPHLDRLEFVQADLTTDADWPAAMTGITYVMSVAAPVFVNGATVTDAVANTAEAGTLRILKAAAAAGVKRLVMTANFGAVGFSSPDPTHVITEDDWTDPQQSGLSAYEQSKLLAEKAAWNYVADHNHPFELVTVNAGAMLGPALDDHVSGSFGLVKRLLTGQATPNLTVSVVDVRDVADIHVRAMTTPAAANQRFLAVEDHPISMKEIRTLVKTRFPELADRLPKHFLPNIVINVLAPFSSAIKEGHLMLHLSHHVSNQKARTVLGWTPLSSAKTAVTEAVKQLKPTL